MSVERRTRPAFEPEFYQRLLDFYHRLPPSTPHFSKTWEVVSSFHRPLVNALDAKDPALLADVLGDVYHRKVMYGLDSSAEALDVYDLGLGTQEYLTAEYFEAAALRLLRTTAANCCVPAPNAEQADEFAPTPEELATAIEHYLGVRVSFKGGGNVSGLVVGDRYLPHRLIDAAGVAATASRLVSWPAQHVLEIGAGAGWVGYLLTRIGTLYYYTVDLPVVSVIQAYMLASATRPGLVWLAGEPENLEPCFRILGPVTDTTLQGVRCNLAINQNSFPEIAPAEQERLVRLLEDVLQPDGAFLSINHESSVNDQRRAYVPLSASSKFRLAHRSPWWSRPGWVEETWIRNHVH